MKKIINLILFICFSLSANALGQTYFVFTGQTGAANDLDPGEIIRFPFKVSSPLEFGGGSFQIQAGNSGGNITVSLYQDDVSGSPLASTTISSSYIKDTLSGSGYKKVDFRFATPETLVAGNFYIITISSDTSSNSALSKIKDPSGGVYLQSLDSNGDPVAGDPIIAQDCSNFTDVSLNCEESMSGNGGEWSISKSFPEQTISFGSTFTHQIVLTNIGLSNLNSARVLDQLPTDVTLSSIAGTGWTLVSNNSGLLTLDYSGAVGANATSNTLTLNLKPAYNFSGATNYASVDTTGDQSPPTPGSSCAIENACSSSISTAANNKSISGIVKNQSGIAVSGASIRLLDPSNNEILATASSSGDGSYTFSNILPGTYDISFLDYSGKKVKSRPGNGSGNGTRNNLNKSIGINTTTGSVTNEDGFVIDPSGVIYDSSTRLPLSGAEVSLYVTPSGGSKRLVNSSELDTTNGDDNPTNTSSDGIYNFLLNNTAVSGLYEIEVSKSGYTFESVTIAPNSVAYTPGTGGGVESIQAQSSAPSGAEDTTYYLSFNLTIMSDDALSSSNGIINNHIPIDQGDSTAPVIAGPSGTAGDASSAISIPENQTTVTTLTANETVTWSITGGTDSSKLSIDSSTGALTFNSAPDYEVPTDSDTNNTYVVIVTATDSSGNTSIQTVTITVTDVDDNFIDLIRDDLVSVIEKDFEQILLTNTENFNSILDSAIHRSFYWAQGDCKDYSNDENEINFNEYKIIDFYNIFKNQTINLSGNIENQDLDCESGIFEMSNIEFEVVIAKDFSRRANLHYDYIKEQKLNQSSVGGIFYGFNSSENRIDNVARGDIAGYGLSLGSYLIKDLNEDYKANFLFAGHIGKSFYDLTDFQSADIDLRAEGSYKHQSIYYEFDLSGAGYVLSEDTQIIPHFSASGAYGDISDSKVKIINKYNNFQYAKFSLSDKNIYQSLLGISAITSDLEDNKNFTSTSIDILCRNSEILENLECGGQVEFERSYQNDEDFYNSIGFSYSHTKSFSMFSVSHGMRGRLTKNFNYETSVNMYADANYSLGIKVWAYF